MILSRFVNPRARRMAARAGFRARIRHADFLDAGHQRTNQPGHRHFKRIWDAETRAVVGGGLDGRNDFGMRMAENRRPQGADVINQLVAVHVPNARAFGMADEERLAADGAERAHRQIDAAGNVFQRLGKQCFGLSP